MERETVINVMQDIYTSREAAEYLGISLAHLNSLVDQNKISPVKSDKSVSLFYKPDLSSLKSSSESAPTCSNFDDSFDVNNQFVRDAILYYTIQSYFNYNDRKTSSFLNTQYLQGFDFHNGIETNIRFLACALNVSKSAFYTRYKQIKNSFSSLPAETKIIKKGDPVYSKLLEVTDEAPPYLFLIGDENLLNERLIAVVGSRKASEESLDKTRKMVESLVKRNYVIVAGLAKGIDTAAHKAALDAGGTTVAVIGTPINRYYPKENTSLQKRIESEGLVVSQFPPCNPVFRWNFPTRNGTMSGIAQGTIVMEAGEMSGALRQADYALKQDHPVLIPSSLLKSQDLKWPKKYMQKGAVCFANLQEALQVLSRRESLRNVFTGNNLEVVENVEMD